MSDRKKPRSLSEIVNDQCCGEKFTPKRADARYCSNACRQKVYRKRVTDAASTQNEHIVFRTVSRSVENQVPPPGTWFYP